MRRQVFEAFFLLQHVNPVQCIADTTVGLWMLGLKVNFFNDTRLCASPCNTAQQQDSGNRDLKQQDDDAPVVPQLKHGPVPHNPHAFVCTVGKLLEKD